MNLAGPNHDPVPITCSFYMQQMYCTKCSGFIKKKTKRILIPLKHFQLPAKPGELLTIKNDKLTIFFFFVWVFCFCFGWKSNYLCYSYPCYVKSAQTKKSKLKNRLTYCFLPALLVWKILQLGSLQQQSLLFSLNYQ